MPVVRMPDENGTLVRFPDDMPSDQIQALILSRFPNAPELAAERRNASGNTGTSGPWERYQQSSQTGNNGQPVVNSGPWERYQSSISSVTGGSNTSPPAIPDGYRVVSSPGPQLPPGFRLVDDTSADGQPNLTLEQQRALALASARLRLQQENGVQSGFSDLRDAGMIQQTPGNEDLWMPNPPQASEVPSNEALHPVAGVARDLVEGIPIAGPLYSSAVDQMGSHLVGALSGEDPAALREGYQNRLEGYREEHPVLSTGAQITGGTAALAPLASNPVGQAVFGLTGPLLRRAAFGAASGGAIAGTDALVRGAEPQEAVTGPALYGALGGAAGGVVAPHIGRAMGWVGERGGALANTLLNRPQPPTAGYSRPALDTVVRALDADGSLSSQGLVNISRGGPNAMLADAGPNAQSLLDTAVQRSGPGSTAATRAIEQRASQANDDIVQALNQSLGEPRGIHTAHPPFRRHGIDVRHDRPVNAPVAMPGVLVRGRGSGAPARSRNGPQGNGES